MLITKVKLNRYFTHIAFQLILHLVFTIAFGSILSSGLPHETWDDDFLYLWASVTFIYNFIASGISVIGIMIIELLLKKKFSDKIITKGHMLMRFSVIISQIMYIFTCIMMAICFSKKEDYSTATKPLSDLALAYTIIGFWHIFLGTLYLTSGHCVLKKMRDIDLPTNGGNVI